MVEERSKENVYFCKSGDEIGIISKNFGVDGFFFVVINKKNETFLINELDIIIPDECKFIQNNEPIYNCKEHKFTDFLPIQEFNFF